MFRFYFILIVYSIANPIHLSTIEDAFQGYDVDENAFINDDVYQQELIHQAESLLFSDNPLIEQMLSMASSIGDGTNEQMLMLISDAEHQVPDYAVLQSPISDTRIFESHWKPKVESIIIDEPEWLAQTEFFLGALIVFIAFPILLDVEQRKHKNVMILRDVNQMKNSNQLIFIQGSSFVSQEYLMDTLTGIRVQNALRFYRKVEELLENNYGESKWVERENDIQWFDQYDNQIVDSVWKSQIQNNSCTIEGYQLNENQLEKLENWCKVRLNQHYYPEYDIQNNNIYINRLRISYWYIPSQLLSIVCKSYGNQLNPIEIHIPIIESTQDGMNSNTTRQGCQEDICLKVCRWINWNEWSPDEQNIDYVEEGLISLEDIFQSKLSFRKLNLTAYRMITFLMMLFGIWMFFLPIYSVLQLFPMFGQLDIGPYLGAIVGFLFSSVFWLTTVGVSIWQSFYNKKLGLSLIFLAISIVVILIVCTHFDFQIDPQVFDKFNYKLF